MSQTSAPARSRRPTTASTTQDPSRRGWVRVAAEVAVAVVMTLLLVGLLGSATGRPMRAGAAMTPTFAEGQRVWVRAGDAPHRGDVVLLKLDPAWSGAVGDDPGAATRLARWLRLASPPEGSRALVRVVGVPGDEVRADGRGTLSVNGLPVPAGAIAGHRFRVVVPQGRYFVTTDRPSAMSSACYLNRLGAKALPGAEQLVGRVEAVGAPWNGPAARTGADVYTGIAGREVPSAPIMEAGKDPTC